MSVWHSRSGHSHLQTYAEEAARLRKLAASVTTTALRSRLLEEAANQEWFARQATIAKAMGRDHRVRGFSLS